MESGLIFFDTDGKRSADKIIGNEVAFAVPAIGNEGVVTPCGAEVEAGEVGGKRCAGMVVRQPVVAEEDRRFVGAVAGNSADFVVLSVPRHVEGLRKGEMADAGPFGEVPPAHPNGMALDAFFVVKQVSIRHLHFGAFEDVFDSSMLWSHGTATGAKEIGVPEALANEAGDALDVPTGVNGTEGTEVEEHREEFHPLQPVCPFVHAASKLIEGGSVGPNIAGAVLLEETALTIRFGEEDGVVFVVAHNGEGIAAFDHGAHKVEDFPYLGATVDVVAQEEDFAALWVSETVALGLVAEMVEEGEKLGVLTVNVADQVVRLVFDGIHDVPRSLFEMSLPHWKMQYIQL